MSAQTARTYAAVTPNNSADLPGGPADAFYIGGAGNVTVAFAGATVAFNGLTAGSILPIKAARVMATGTTATGIVALYDAA